MSVRKFGLIQKESDLMTHFKISGVVYGFQSEEELIAYFAARTPEEVRVALKGVYRVPPVVPQIPHAA